MSGTERGEGGYDRDESGNRLYRHSGACCSLKCPCYTAGHAAAAALAEHEADAAAHRTEREEARVLLDELVTYYDLPEAANAEIRAFLARTDTGGQEPPAGD